MDKTIGDFLSDEEPAAEIDTPTEPEAQPEAAVAEPVAEQPNRDEQGRFKAKEETGVETEQETPAEPVPPTEQANQLPKAEYAALRDERRKRQEAEARAAALEAHYARLAQQQPQQPQQPAADFWDDPQSFMDQRFSQMGQTLLQQWEQRQQVQRINASEEAAKAKYADYADAYSAFEQAVRLNPTLAAELAQASDPGEFAYAKGKTALEIQRVGSVDELRKQIRAELEAEARAAIQPVAQKLPSTTAADGSVGARGGPEWSGPTPIENMLG